MKVIIAGGRDYEPNYFKYASGFKELDIVAELNGFLHFTEVVSGGARGADKMGEDIADCLELPVKKFLPDWDTYGKGAGFIRNQAMSDYADALILFKGGKGTEHMFITAKSRGLKLIDLR